MLGHKGALLPSGMMPGGLPVFSHPGSRCTLASRPQRRPVCVRSEVSAPKGGGNSGENRRRKPWRKRSKDAASKKDKVDLAFI